VWYLLSILLIIFRIVTGGRYAMQYRSQCYVLSGKRHQEPHKYHWWTAFVQISSVWDTHTLRSAGRNGLRTLDQWLFVSGRGIQINSKFTSAFSHLSVLWSHCVWRAIFRSKLYIYNVTFYRTHHIVINLPLTQQ